MKYYSIVFALLLSTLSLACDFDSQEMPGNTVLGKSGDKMGYWIQNEGRNVDFVPVLGDKDSDLVYAFGIAVEKVSRINSGSGLHSPKYVQ